jgi:hypothetical protein
MDHKLISLINGIKSSIYESIKGLDFFEGSKKFFFLPKLSNDSGDINLAL